MLYNKDATKPNKRNHVVQGGERWTGQVQPVALIHTKREGSPEGAQGKTQTHSAIKIYVLKLTYKDCCLE